MWLPIVLALNMSMKEKIDLRLCRAQAQTIKRIHNKNDQKSIKDICKWALNAHELDIDEGLFEECWEFLRNCR